MAVNVPLLRLWSNSTVGFLSGQFCDRVIQTQPPMLSSHVCPEMPMASAGQPGGRWGWTDPGSRAMEMTAGAPHRTPWCFHTRRHHHAHYSVPAAGCQASRAGRYLIALAPSIMSGNELRVTLMARNMYTNIQYRHTEKHTHSHHHSGEQKALLQIEHTAPCRWCTGGEREEEEEQRERKEDIMRCSHKTN